MILELPRDLVEVLNVSQTETAARLQELIAIELFREGQISSGKAAEILGCSKLAFIQLLARRGIPYFTESSEELKADVEAVMPICY